MGKTKFIIGDIVCIMALHFYTNYTCNTPASQAQAMSGIYRIVSISDSHGLITIQNIRDNTMNPTLRMINPDNIRLATPHEIARAKHG